MAERRINVWSFPANNIYQPKLTEAEIDLFHVFFTNFPILSYISLLNREMNSSWSLKVFTTWNSNQLQCQGGFMPNMTKIEKQISLMTKIWTKIFFLAKNCENRRTSEAEQRLFSTRYGSIWTCYFAYGMFSLSMPTNSRKWGKQLWIVYQEEGK